MARADRNALPRPGPGADLRGFPPILDRRIERLILGSFPSAASLAAGQYYAHPGNQFWALLGQLVDEPLAELTYADQVQRALRHRVGIWDVYGACQREGSADSAIRKARTNPLTELLRRAPHLRAVAFNGSAAGRFQPLFEQAGLRVTVLPSSSRAHASLSFDQKLRFWRAWWHQSSTD
jgi:hypoxanthine-DNA glycosylase